MKFKFDYEFQCGDIVLDIEYEYEPTPEDAVDYVCSEEDLDLRRAEYDGAVKFAEAFGMEEVYESEGFKEFIKEAISEDVKEKAIAELKKTLEAK